MIATARVMQLGYTRDNGCGVGSGCFARWGLVPIGRDGLPLLRWRDGKPRHVGPRVSGKQAPMWLQRAEGFIASVGPLGLAELDDVAHWYQAHRVGSYPLDRLEMLAAK